MGHSPGGVCAPQCPSTDCPKGWSPRELASRIGCSLMDQKGRYGSQREAHTHDCRLGQWMRPHTCQRRCTGRPQAKGDTLCPDLQELPQPRPSGRTQIFSTGTGDRCPGEVSKKYSLLIAMSLSPQVQESCAPELVGSFFSQGRVTQPSKCKTLV